MQLTLRTYIDGVTQGTLDPQKVVDFYLNKAKKTNDKLFSFIRLHDDYVQKNIKNIQT